jgi:hypothetical protein
MMSGIAFLTLVVNGSTTGALVHQLGLVTASQPSKMAWRATTFRLHSKMLHIMDALQRSELYKYADWEVVYSHLPTFTKMCSDDLQERVKFEYNGEVFGGENGGKGEKICATMDAVNKPYLARVHHRFEPPKPCPLWLCFPCSLIAMCSRALNACAARGDGDEEGSVAAAGGGISMVSTPVARQSIQRQGSSLSSNDGMTSNRASAAPATMSGSSAAGPSSSSSSSASAAAVIDIGADPQAQLSSQMATDAAEMWPFLCEARHRFLNLVKHEYWEELHSGKVGENACMLLLEANAVVQDKVANFPAYPHSVSDRVNARLALWPIVEDLMTHPCLRSLDGVMSKIKGIKGLVHLRTFAVYDLMIDVATSFCDVHRHAIEEFRRSMTHGEAHDGKHNVRTFLAAAVSNIVCREATHDLQLAHDIFDMIPHESVMGRTSLTTICIRNILRSSERLAIEYHESGGLEHAEFELVTSAISRCLKIGRAHV